MFDANAMVTQGTYPDGYPRTSCKAKLPNGTLLNSLDCPSCPPGARRWATLQNYTVLLTGSTVVIFPPTQPPEKSCTVHQTLELDSHCSPRELVLSPSGHDRLFVACLSTDFPAYHLIDFDGGSFRSTYTMQQGNDFPSTAANGIFYSDGRVDYCGFIAENYIVLFDVLSSHVHLHDWNFDDDDAYACGTKQRLLTVPPEEESIGTASALYLVCDNEAAKKLFSLTINRNEGAIQAKAPPVSIDADSDALVAREYFAVKGRNNLTVHSSSDASFSRYSYSQPLLHAGFLDQPTGGGPFLLVCPAHTRCSLIDVDVDFRNHNSGTYELPGVVCASSQACLFHTLAVLNSSLLFAFTGSSDQSTAEVFDIGGPSPSRPLSPVRDVDGRPVAVAFFAEPIPSTTVPPTQSSTSSSSSTLQIPSSNTPSTDGNGPNMPRYVTIIISIAVILSVIVIVVVIGLAVVGILCRKKCVRCKRKNLFEHGEAIGMTTSPQQASAPPRDPPTGQEAAAEEEGAAGQPMQESTEADISINLIVPEETSSAYGTDSHSSSKSNSTLDIVADTRSDSGDGASISSDVPLPNRNPQSAQQLRDAYRANSRSVLVPNVQFSFLT